MIHHFRVTLKMMYHPNRLLKVNSQANFSPTPFSQIADWNAMSRKSFLLTERPFHILPSVSVLERIRNSVSKRQRSGEIEKEKNSQISYVHSSENSAFYQGAHWSTSTDDSSVNKICANVRIVSAVRNRSKFQKRRISPLAVLSLVYICTSFIYETISVRGKSEISCEEEKTKLIMAPTEKNLTENRCWPWSTRTPDLPVYNQWRS